MILQFTVKNFRSIKDEVTLHLEATGSKKAGKTNLIKITDNKYLLPSVGVFGANASGKSNILKALNFMIKAMHNEQPLQNPPASDPLLQPYRLDKASLNKPTFLQIVLCNRENKDYKEYIYGFEIKTGFIVSEQLTIREKNKTNFVTRIVFERHLKEGKTEFKFNSQDKGQLEPLSKRVTEEGLALTVFAANSSSVAREVINLVNISLRNGRPTQFYSIEIPDNQHVSILAQSLYRQTPSMLDEINSMITKADLNIQNININAKGIFTTHKQYGDDATHEIFSLEDESWGTQKFFMTSVIIRDALRTGGIVILDDLGSSMHPLLTAEIVKQFDDPNINRIGAQLIYSSHEDYLLSSDVGLRKDQIYFTKKTPQETTVLQALSEYDIREELDFRRNYLFGRFGGLPNLKLSESAEMSLNDKNQSL